MTCDESWRRMWENTWKAKGEARESLIVSVGASSPSNAPSLSVLQIESTISVVRNNCYGVNNYHSRRHGGNHYHSRRHGWRRRSALSRFRKRTERNKKIKINRGLNLSRPFPLLVKPRAWTGPVLVELILLKLSLITKFEQLQFVNGLLLLDLIKFKIMINLSILNSYPIINMCYGVYKFCIFSN